MQFIFSKPHAVRHRIITPRSHNTKISILSDGSCEKRIAYPEKPLAISKLAVIFFYLNHYANNIHQREHVSVNR